MLPFLFFADKSTTPFDTIYSTMAVGAHWMARCRGVDNSFEDVLESRVLSVDIRLEGAE